jgi:tRNA pseudouridine55 synthase
MRRPEPGVLLHSKPVGATSFSVVQGVQAALEATPGKAWKVCHAGALDPFASGLLPVLVGSATKLFEWVHELPKTYEATVAWGAETDTADAGGVTVSSGAVGHDAEAAAAALASFVGWREQVPPATSNKRVDGERAWKRAHRGEAVELPPSTVYLHAAEWVSHELPRASVLRITCRGGYYVRALARDLGRALGCGAHLVALRRTEIGPWKEPDAPTQLAGLDAFPWLARLELHDDEWGQLKRAAGEVSVRGRPKPAKWRVPAGFPAPTPLIAAVHQGRVVALVEQGAGGVRVKTLLLPPL